MKYGSSMEFKKLFFVICSNLEALYIKFDIANLIAFVDLL